MNSLSIDALVLDEAARRENFPVCKSKIFLAHAGVTVLPKFVADPMCDYVQRSCEQHQEFGDVMRVVMETRKLAARLIGAQADEIALLGPTSLGLSLVANGLPWQEGDELICYDNDYPANVYPWMELQRRGVVVKFLRPEQLGVITPEMVEQALTPRTRLVALASCNFLSGFRIDIDAIGKLLQSRGVLFSLDAIQSLGAFPISVEHVDFLSADAHKWLLGPMAIGIVFVKKKHFELLRPTLIGAWNVQSPRFVAQREIHFVPTAQRYEPGVLNVAGIYGMKAALEMFLAIGMDAIAARLIELKQLLATQLDALGFEILSASAGHAASSITAFRHPKLQSEELFSSLEKNGVVASLRHDRESNAYIRFSPHFYNTESEIRRAVEILQAAIAPAIPV